MRYFREELYRKSKQTFYV